VSNYSANIDALARRFRVIVPDLPGYGRSTKDSINGIDQRDPFGSLADAVRGLLDALGLDGPTWSATPTAAPPPCASASTPRNASIVWC
jgi:pimeloyl-ACP methyl ester carboxylesterase